MQLTVVVPTFNEADNIVSLVTRLGDALAGLDAEVLFVDDSTDDTVVRINDAAATSRIPVRVIHRAEADGGLGGAVALGFAEAASEVCIVMDGDLQHPPESARELYERWAEGDVDVVVASRYLAEGDSGGLAGRTRSLVSKASTALTKAMFPIRLARCTDPMTGFFLVDTRAIAVSGLRPRGFKILLEILARNDVRVSEIPFRFATRRGGVSKASATQGMRFLTQLAALRFGKMSIFAVIGAFGAVANLAIMWVLIQLGVPYIVAAVIAAEVTIVGNFLLQERFVFQDMRERASGGWVRFAKSFTFNNAEAAVRIPILALMVETWHISSVLAAAITLAAAFILRFVFHSLVVYAPKKKDPPSTARRVAESIDDQAMQPGEL